MGEPWGVGSWKLALRQLARLFKFLNEVFIRIIIVPARFLIPRFQPIGQDIRVLATKGLTKRLPLPRWAELQQRGPWKVVAYCFSAAVRNYCHRRPADDLPLGESKLCVCCSKFCEISDASIQYAFLHVPYMC